MQQRRVTTIAMICLTVQCMAMEVAAQDKDRGRFLCAPTIEVSRRRPRPPNSFDASDLSVP
jgi:hypothetical protein